jgi:hypothetical protein
MSRRLNPNPARAITGAPSHPGGPCYTMGPDPHDVTAMEHPAECLRGTVDGP